MEEKFIACVTTLFIKKLRPALDIEKSKNFEYIKRSGKSFIGWHPTMSEERGRSIWEHFKANNLPAYFVERGALPNTIMIDPNGFLCDSSSYDEENWNHPLTPKQECQIDDYILDLTLSESSLEHQYSQRIRREEDFRSVVNAQDREIVFVPLQLETDTVIQKWSDWTEGVERFFQLVKWLAASMPDKLFLVKPHPLSKLSFDAKDNVVNVSGLHYKDCLAYCNKVLLINSGVGAQAMAWGKPVIVAGRSWYQFDGINYKANNETDIIDRLITPLSVDKEKAKRFLHFLKFEFYSDCIQIKQPKSYRINRTDDAEYTNIRIFRGRQ